MNKTIYIRDADVAVWDRAKEIAGVKLAPVIIEGLRRYIEEHVERDDALKTLESRVSELERRS